MRKRLELIAQILGLILGRIIGYILGYIFGWGWILEYKPTGFAKVLVLH